MAQVQRVRRAIGTSQIGSVSAEVLCGRGRGAWLARMDAVLAGEAVQRLHVWRSAVEELAAAAERVADDPQQAAQEIALLHVLSDRAARAFAQYEALVLAH